MAQTCCPHKATYGTASRSSFPVHAFSCTCSCKASFFTHSRVGKPQRRPSLPAIPSAFVGIRYRAVAASLGSPTRLPSPAQTALRAVADLQVSCNRGYNRRKNDGTVDTRAHHFHRWAVRYGYTVQLLSSLSNNECLQTLAIYVHDVAIGDNVHYDSKMSSDTVSNYLHAARLFLQVCRQAPVNTMDPSRPGALHPLLADQLAFRSRWSRSNDRREPITAPTLANLSSRQALLSTDSPLGHTYLLPAVFDWLCLACFTGSRPGEYAQMSGSKTTFSPVPKCPNDPFWEGKPVAFVASEFMFLSPTNRIIPHGDLPTTPLEAVACVRIRFRHDKSSTNFSKRSFYKANHAFLCPVRASRRIFCRAHTLKLSPFWPLGSYRDNKAGKTFLLRSTDIIKTLRVPCKLAHPCPNDYPHRHVHLLVAHSTRITAAVALANAGASPDVIAHRLRWHRDSVEHYLRDCSRAVGLLTQQAIAGVLLI